MVVLLPLPDLVHRVGLVFVGGRRVLVRMVDCNVLSGLACVGWTVRVMLDFRLSGELEFFGGCLRRAEDEFVLKQLHYLVVRLL